MLVGWSCRRIYSESGLKAIVTADDGGPVKKKFVASEEWHGSMSGCQCGSGKKKKRLHFEERRATAQMRAPPAKHPPEYMDGNISARGRRTLI